jgi:hypothetical protein
VQACPTCNTTFADDLQFCTQDATPLVKATKASTAAPLVVTESASSAGAVAETPRDTLRRPAVPGTAKNSAPGQPQQPYPPFSRVTPSSTYRAVAAPRVKFSALAVWAFVLSLCFTYFSVPAIVLGHLSRRAVRRGQRRGGGLALAALIIGYASLPLTVALWVAVLQQS